MTDLEKAQDQLELALKEIKSIKGRNVELLYDYVFEAHRLVKKLTIPHVVQQSEQLCQYEPDNTTAMNCKHCGNPKWTHDCCKLA